ncbi:hypothetical protein GCM10027020_38760 [Nocardioides salsibiostraticola]
MAGTLAALALGLTACGSDTPDPTAEPPTVEPAISSNPPPVDPIDPVDPVDPVDPPQVAYLRGKTIHLPGGDSWTLPQRYDSGRLLDGVFFGVSYDDENDHGTLQGIHRDGTIDDHGAITSPLAANRAGTTLAWMDADHRLQTRWTEDGVDLGVLSSYAVPRRVIGGPNCHEDQDGCVVFHDERGQAHTADSHGIDDSFFPEALSVDDATEDRVVAVQTSATDTGSCSAVLDLTVALKKRTVAETCDYSLGRFSPDGAHLSAYEAYRDGIGMSYVALLDATTLEEITRFSPAGFIATAVWENDGQVLVNTYDYETGRWSVERLGLDGSTQTVLGPIRGEDVRPVFTLMGDS